MAETCSFAEWIGGTKPVDQRACRSFGDIVCPWRAFVSYEGNRPGTGMHFMIASRLAAAAPTTLMVFCTVAGGPF